MNTSFLGAMIWFTGVVEDVTDPQQLGRTKVRCYGYHTEDKSLLPTADLPWAAPVVPITSASMAGVGVSATGLQPGSWVVGFFKDGEAAQNPVTLGSIPSASFKSNKDTGFKDPTGVNPRRNGRDIPQLATRGYSSSQFYVRKKGLRQTEVPTAVSPGLAATTQTDDEERKTWNNYDPEKHVKPLYPMNHVTEYASGHCFEVDDRPKYSRISRMHKSGTYEEIIDDGSRTITVKGDEYEVTFGGKNILVKGNVNFTVEGDSRTLVKGNYHLEVDGDKTEYIRGSSHHLIAGNEVKEIKSARNVSIVGQDSLTVDGPTQHTLNSSLTQNISGATSITNVGTRSLKILGDENRFSKSGFTLVAGVGGAQTMKIGPSGLKIDSDGDITIIARNNITQKANAIYLN